jgi:hypothetical protein
MFGLYSGVTVIIIAFVIGTMTPLLIMAVVNTDITNFDINFISNHTEDYKACLSDNLALQSSLKEQKTITCNCPSSNASMLWLPFYIVFGALLGAFSFYKVQEYQNKK